MISSKHAYVKAVAIALFALLPASLSSQTASATGERLTIDEVKELIKDAATPEQYMKLAGFFRQEETKQTESAKMHDGLSRTYQFTKVPSPAVADMQKHCEDLVHAERNAASAARAMAEYYEEMAELTRKSK